MLVSKLQPGYKIPSRGTFTSKLLRQRAEDIRSISLEKLKKAENHTLTIEFDSWTSVQSDNLLAVSITNESGNSMLADLVDSTAERSTGLYIAAKVLTAVKETGINPNKFIGIVTDEASSYKVAREELSCLLPGGKIINYRCMAHWFNLVGASMSKHPTINEILKRLMDLVLTINRSKILWSKLKEIGSNKPTQIVPTRWYSTSLTINSILGIKEDLSKVPRTPQFSAQK